MKKILKPVFLKLNRPIDIVFSILCAPAALLLRTYRRIGSARLPLTTGMLKRMGVFPIRNHYYEPLFNDAQLTKKLTEDRNLPGIDLNIAGQLAFLKKLTFSAELTAMKLDQPQSDPGAFSLGNISFEAGDADYLYQFIRAVKPRKIIEIGSGNSTRIAKKAVDKTVGEVGPISHTCIEPYEMPWLESLGGVNVIRKRVEDCDFDWSKELASGDFLFIDSSHIIRPQGDVLKEYLEILPQLASGVYVHIHDIFTPKDYLESCLIKDVYFWNEQYLLEALLSNNSRYEIIGALNHLKHNYYQELKAVCPYLAPEREPGSFYIRVR